MNEKTSFWNMVVVRSENAQHQVIEAVAYNLSDKSYISITNLGYTVMQQPTLQLDQITDPQILQESAWLELNFGALGSESIEIETLPMPFTGPHDVLGLYYYAVDSQTLLISTGRNPYLVTSFKREWTSGTAGSQKWVAGRLVLV